MKANKHFSHKLLSCFVMLSVLVSTMLISTSVFAQSSDMYSSGASAGISYSFTGDDKSKAGFAEGTITVKANDSNNAGSYYLYWANDSKALEGYYPIDKLSVTTSGVSTKMYTQTAIPADATKIVAFKASSEPTDKSVAKADAVYSIPKNKQFPHSGSEKQYSFGSYSDIHIANDGYGSGKYPYDEVHWRKALDSAAARNLDFIVTGGDNINNQNGNSENNYVSEWKSYQKVLAESDYCNPIYESIGNHEMWTSKSTAISAFVKATGLMCDEESLKSDKAYYTFDEPKTGDHFIIMSIENNFNPKNSDEFSTTQLNWVKNLLSKYKNDGHNTYIYEHAGFWKWGVGDDEDDPYYDIPLGLDYSGNKQLQQILYDNPNVMFFCGHTHIYFGAQFNYMDYDTSAGKSTAKMVHNSSVGGIRKPLSKTPHLGNMDRTNREDETEGYFVDSYGDYIICNGANLYYNLVDPKTTYIVEGCGSAGPITPTSTTTATTTSTTKATTTSTTTATTTSTTKATTTTTAPAQEYSITYNIDSSAYLKSSNSSKRIVANSRYQCLLSDTSGMTPSSTEKYTKTVKVTMGGTDITSSVVTSAGSDVNRSFTIDIPSVTGNIVITATGESKTLFAIGDVNMDSVIDVQDATVIQKYISHKKTLTDEQIALADHNGDGRVRISDVTSIQRAVLNGNAKSNTLVASGSSSDDLSALLTTVKNYLSSKYTYSSYDQYMAVKKEYRYCLANSSSFSGSDALAHYNSLSSKLDTLKAIAGDVSGGGDTTVTVYFNNTSNWSTVKAYMWTGGTNNTWPGESMTKVSGTIYKITVDSSYENIIFNNGSGTQTGNLTIPGNNQIYSYSSGSWSAYTG